MSDLSRCSLIVGTFIALQTANARSVEAADLQKAIDAARPGSVVVIRRGVYRQPVTIGKPLVLRGEAAADCILGVTSDDPALLVRSKGPVTVDSLTIRWQLATSEGRKGPACALAVRDSRATVRGCRFTAAGGFKRCPSAVESGGFSSLTLEDCRFEGFEFAIGYTGGAEGSITDCVVLNPGHCGITVYSGSKLDIARCIVTGSRYHGIRSTGGTLFVRDSLIIENRNRGIYLGNKSASGRISNNVIARNGTGISAFAHTDVRIGNNLILASGYAGLATQDSCLIYVSDNVFQANTRGIVVVEADGKDRFTVGRNTFWKNRSDTENLTRPRNAIAADPLFKDPRNGDFSARAAKVKAARQGLSNPAVFKSLWKIWTATSQAKQKDSVPDKGAQPAD